jgi:hypothetical protein
MRIERAEAAGGGLDLGLADVGGLEQHLALQVGDLDHIRIDEPQTPDTGGGEIERRRGPKPARADDNDRGALQRLLARPAHLAQHQMPGVALDLVGGKAHLP